MSIILILILHLFSVAIADGPKCYNGGYLDDGSCVCPDRYEGVYCEAVISSNSYIPYKINQKTFNILNLNLWSPFYGQKSYAAFKSAIEEHMSNNSGSYKYYNQYKLTGVPIFQETGTQNSDMSNVKLIYDNSTSPFTVDKGQNAVIYWCFGLKIYQNLTTFMTEQKLQDTVVTILTQHPPLDADDIRQAALDQALGFRVKVNVLWVKDQVFTDCSSFQKEIEALREFSQATGGVFLMVYPEHGENSDVKWTAQRVLETHRDSQPLVSMSFEDCKNKSVSWTPPNDNSSYLFALNGNNVLPTDDSYTNCELRTPRTSIDLTTQLFATNSKKCHQVSIVADGSCSLQLYSIGSPRDVQVHVSWVDDVALDSARIETFDGTLMYPSVHVVSKDLDDSVLGITAMYESTAINFTKRSTSFEWIGNSSISCVTDRMSFLNLEINMAGNRSVQRSVPVLCGKKQPETTVKPTEKFFEIPEEPIRKVDKNATRSFNRSFVFGYAADVKSSTYTQLSESILRGLPSFSNYGSVIFDAVEPVFSLNQDKETFSTFLLSEYTKTKPALNPSQPSDVTIVGDLSKNVDDIRKGSFLLLLLNRFAAAGAEVSIKDFSNRDTKIFQLLTSAALDEQLSFGGSRSGRVYDRLAAQTNGHFIVCDDTLYMNNDSLVTSECDQLVTNNLTPLFAQDLLASTTLKSLKSSIPLPEIDLSSGTDKINVTVTVSFAVNDQVPTALSFSLNYYTSESPMMINFKRVAANFYTAQLTLSPSENHFLLRYVGAAQDVLVRFWTPRVVDHESEFVDLRGAIGYPDTVNGAALRFQHDGTLDSASLKIFSCDGTQPIKFDTNQDSVNTISTKLIHFVPYLCDTVTNGCVDGTQDKYDVQVTTNVGTVHLTSFTCSPSSTLPLDTCKKTDFDGNVLCSGQSPYKRGPTGKLTDCSRKGNLVYQGVVGPASDDYADDYKCVCNSDATGLSCEIGTCTNAPPTPELTPKTYTVVLVADGTSNANLMAEDANGILDAPASGLWKYRLFVYCKGTVVSQYNGNSKASFIGSFSKVNSDCTDDGSHDLTDIYKSAVEGIGQNVKGVMVIVSETKDSMTVNLDEFIMASHAYQQQVFLINSADGGSTTATNTSLTDATFSTGGFYLQTEIDDSSNKLGVDKDFINFFLSQKTSISSYQSNLGNGRQISVESNDYAIGWNIKLDGTRCNSFGQYSYCPGGSTGTVSIVSPLNRLIVYSKFATPTVQAVKSISSSDRDTVPLTKANTIFAIASDECEVLPEVDSYVRIDRRQNCGPFTYSMYDPTSRYSSGLNQLSMNLKSDGITVERIYSFGATESTACENGGTFDNSFGGCQCSDGFTGPSCRQVTCASNSTLNAWNEACICPAGTFGRFCEKPSA